MDSDAPAPENRTTRPVWVRFAPILGRAPALTPRQWLTILAYTLLTGATALAQDAHSFIALQFFARIFTTAEVLLAIVVISEEFDPETRGWGIGALFAISASGVGLAAALLSLVELSTGGWRILYAVGLLPLAAVAFYGGQGLWLIPLCVALTVILVALYLPETAGRTLESIAPQVVVAPPPLLNRTHQEETG